jgi:hypothetical protein
MLRRYLLSTTLALTVSLFGLMATAPVFAAATSGTGPAQAMTPSDTWTSEPSMGQTWYSFQYAGDLSQINVLMNASPTAYTGFKVYTPEEVRLWAQGEALNAIGAGAVNPDLGGDLSWSGNFNEGGTYYIVVSDTGTGTSYYQLQVTGSGVSLPLTATQAPVAMTAPAAMAAAAASTSGITPDQAIHLPASNVIVPANSSVWFSFNYAGGSSQILLWLDAGGQSGLSFSVFTPFEEQQWVSGASTASIGMGSANPDIGGDLAWSGNFDQGGVYFVRVDNTTSGPLGFSMNIQGSGVW